MTGCARARACTENRLRSVGPCSAEWQRLYALSMAPASVLAQFVRCPTGYRVDGSGTFRVRWLYAPASIAGDEVMLA